MEKTGIELIAEERKRQIEKEGWTAEHDAQHNHHELARAAACYATPGYIRKLHITDNGTPFGWPFSKDCWKPSPLDRKRELVKAGALIAAEIDRLQREQPDTEVYAGGSEPKNWPADKDNLVGKLVDKSGELPKGVTKRDVRLRFLQSINGKKIIEKMDASFYDESISYYFNLCRFLEKVRQENRWRELWDAMDGIANKPQTDANKNEPTREQKADFLQTTDADKVEEEAARRKCRQVRIRPCWAAIKEKAKRITTK